MCELCGLTDTFDSDTIGTAGALCTRVFADANKGGAFCRGGGIVTHTQTEAYVCTSKQKELRRKAATQISN